MRTLPTALIASLAATLPSLLWTAPTGVTPMGPSAKSPAQEDQEHSEDPAEDPRKVEFEEVGIRAVLPPLDGLKSHGPDGRQVLGAWSGTLGDAGVRIALFGLPRTEFAIEEPDLVASLVLRNIADDPNRGPHMRFGSMELVPGPFGIAPYAATLVAERLSGTDVAGMLFVVAGVVPSHCYVFEVTVTGKLDKPSRAAIDTFIKDGIRYAGPARAPEWTEEEVETRWKKDVPVDLHGDLDKVIRTKNYIIFTNSAGGNTFAKAMEENFSAIKKVYPFDEIEGRRLMPVFLFRLPEEYYDFLGVKIGWPRETAARSKGVASGDWYATYYESPKDTVHIHEATHQIFANRLLLAGGGSWFQEGVAEFMEGDDNSLKNLGRGAARRGIYTPFREFFALSSLLYSSAEDRVSGGSAAGDNYVQAGSIIAFVKSDKRTRGKFQDFIHAIGSLRRSDIPAIERELDRLFGVDIEGFEKMWKDHYK